MKVFTIGFTRRSAEDFFTVLKRSGAERIVDVRLNNSSQLAGFSKRDDLRFFLQSICGMEYIHLPELAPTQEMLEAYKSKQMVWAVYEKQFLELMRERRVHEVIPREVIANGCLLCSESTPEKCHRRLVAEYLQRAWSGLEITHL